MNPSIFTSNFLTIDMDEGLQRLGGNKNLYIEILNDFYQHNHTIFQHISEKIQNAEWDKAKLLSHSVKGASGNLALIALFKVSVELDLAIKNKQFEEVTLILPLFERALDASFALIKKIVSENKNTETAIQHILNDDALKSLLIDFNQQLSFQNIEALDTIKELKAYFNRSEYALALEEISDALNQFDFEIALDHFKKLNLLHQ